MRKKATPKIALKCVFCKELVKADNTIKAVLCSRCTARLTGSPVEIGKFPKDTTQPKVKKVKGKKVVKKKRVKKSTKKGAVSKPTSKTSGWGRGWHLKKKFRAPTGDVYKFGQLVKSNAVMAGSK